MSLDELDLDPRTAAQHAVDEAKTLENLGAPDRAEKFWLAAEQFYIEAGLDPAWIDDAEIID